MTQNELALGLGRSVTTIKEWLAQGIIPRDGTLLECALAAMNHFAAVKAGHRARGASIEGGEVLDLAEERARLAKMQADGQEMKNAEARGELIQRSEVRSIWARRILSFKERIRSIPVISLARVPGFTKPMARRLSEIIDEALTELADGGTGSGARKRRRSAGAGSDGAAAAPAKAKRKRVGGP